MPFVSAEYITPRGEQFVEAGTRGGDLPPGTFSLSLSLSGGRVVTICETRGWQEGRNLEARRDVRSTLWQMISTLLPLTFPGQA